MARFFHKAAGFLLFELCIGIVLLTIFVIVSTTIIQKISDQYYSCLAKLYIADVRQFEKSPPASVLPFYIVDKDNGNIIRSLFLQENFVTVEGSHEKISWYSIKE